MSHLAVAPFLWVDTDCSDDGRLTISCNSNNVWVAETLAHDLKGSAGLRPPWLPRLSNDTPNSAVFQLPPGPGVTLRALWPSLSVDERAGLTVSLLKTLTRAWPFGLLPRSGVLCDAEGVLWLSPPLRASVNGASKTWDEWQFDEYAIGGMNTTLTQSLAFTLMRLVGEVKLSEFYSLRTSPMIAPSSRVAWLRPLDALVTEANEDLLQKWDAAADCQARWASALAVLEDQYQASAPGLGELVARAWPAVEPASRWE